MTKKERIWLSIFTKNGGGDFQNMQFLFQNLQNIIRFLDNFKKSSTFAN